MIVYTPPALAAYTVIAKTHLAIQQANYPEGSGLIIRNPSNSALVALGISYQGNIVVSTRSSATAAGSFAGNVVRSIAPRYWKIKKNSATSWDFYASEDGIGWMPVLLAYNPSIASGEQIGFAVNSNSATYAADVACHWLRIR